MRLLLLRHGQTFGNTVGALDTAFPGLGLTDLGHRQAEAAARALADRPLAGLYVSSLTRTHQTAVPIGRTHDLESRILDGLREVSAGDNEMGTSPEAVESYIGTVGAWIERRYDVRMPGGESGFEFLERYDDAVGSILDDGHETAILVSHGAAIRTWVSARVSGLESHPQATAPLHNTACIEVIGDGRTWELTSWHSEPIGGAFLEDVTAPDPTGQEVDQAD